MGSETPEKALSEKIPKIVNLDLKGRKLVSALSINTRLSHSQIGKSLGLSKDSVRYRIGRLKEDQIYLTPLLIINPYALGLQYHSIYLRLNNLNTERELGLIKFLSEHPYTVWCGMTGGEWDLGIHLFSKSSKHFAEILGSIKDQCGDSLIDFLALENISMYSYRNLPNFYIKENDPGINIEKRDTSFQTMLKKPVVNVSDKIFKIDEINSKILTELSRDPNISVAILSDKLNLAFDTVKNRMMQLIENNVILAFNPLLTITSLGLIANVILLETKNMEDEQTKEKFEKFLQSHPNMGYLTRSQGKWDWQLYVSTRNRYEFYAALRELRTKFSDNIRNYTTLDIISDFKFTFTPEGVIKEIFSR